MDLYRLRYFVALGQELNFTRAAERAHVTQQAMSRAVALLEREVGGDLVVRGTRGCSLTALGHLVLADAVELLRSADAMASRWSRPDARAAGRLDVIVFNEGPVAEDALTRHRRRYPDVEVVVHRMTEPGQLLAPLLAGRVDAVVGLGSLAADAEVETVVLQEVPRVAVVPTTSEWADATGLTEDDLLDATFGPRHPLEPPGWEGDWNLVPERGEQPRRAGFELDHRCDRQAAQVTAAGCVFTQAESYAREAADRAPGTMTLVPMPTARPVEITLTTAAGARTEARELVETFATR